jgi:Raf kinase inhibitor-like YbhB/YbcL family protein
MRIAHVDHLVLTVLDIDRTIDWYTRVLGMRAVTFSGNRRALSFGSQKINLHQNGADLAPVAAHPTPGSADLCLVSAITLPQVQAHLAELGVVVEEGPISRTGATGPVTSLYVRDPDHNLIEISTYDSGRPQAPDPYDMLPPVPAFTLTSGDIADGQPLASTHLHGSIGGDNRSPQLAWSGAPASTRGYAVTCYDPDDPTGSGFWHWLMLGLPADASHLSNDAGNSDGTHLPPGAYHVRNDFGSHHYDGAAPAPGDPTHRYLFAVHALDTNDLELDANSTAGYAGFMMTAHTVGRTVLRPTHRNPGI